MNRSLQQRREKERQARYEAILDAAETMFFSKGYDKTTMDDIARTAKLSRALLYVYFRDKAAIQCGIMLRAGDAMRDQFRAAMANADTGLKQLQALGDAYYRFSCEQSDYFHTLTQAHGAPLDVDEVWLQRLDSAEAQTMTLMCQAIEQGVEDGSLDRARIADPLQTAYYLRGALHGVMMLCQAPQHPACNHTKVDAAPLITYTLNMLMLSMAAQ